MTGGPWFDTVELSTDAGRDITVTAVHTAGSCNPLLAADQLHQALGLPVTRGSAYRQLIRLPGCRVSTEEETQLLPAQRRVLLVTLDAAIQWLTSLGDVKAAMQLSSYRKEPHQHAASAVEEQQQQRQQDEPPSPRLTLTLDPTAAQPTRITHPVPRLRTLRAAAGRCA